MQKNKKPVNHKIYELLFWVITRFVGVAGLHPPTCKYFIISNL